MRARAKMNAMRSGVVVFGALAFGYLTLHLGFKPYLDRARRTMELEELGHSQSQSQSQSHPEQQQEQLIDHVPESSSTLSHGEDFVIRDS